MAKTPTPTRDAQGEAFVREVDEAYRQDRLTDLWSRYGRALLVLLGVGLIAAAAYLWWQEQQVADRGEQAEAFDAAVKGLELGNADARDEIEALARSEVAGYSELARLKTAEFMLDDGNVDGAVAAYRAIAADSSVELPLRDLARLQAARLSFDESEPQAIISELAGLAEPDSAWFGVAGEMVAAAHVKAGNTDAAGALYRDMAQSEDLPPGLRERAGQLALAYGNAAGTLDTEAEPDAPTSGDETAEDTASEANE